LRASRGFRAGRSPANTATTMEANRQPIVLRTRCGSMKGAVGTTSSMVSTAIVNPTNEPATA